MVKKKFDEKGRHLRYLDYLSEYKWDSFGKGWSCRITNKTPSIGKLIYIHPTCGEAFYLRMLLGHQVGCQSFADIRSIGGLTCPTYRAACETLGLLGDDKEWTYVIDDTSVSVTPLELRSLFTHMLLFCEISNPLALWKKQWQKMSADIVCKVANNTNLTNIHVSDNDLHDYVLYEIELLLNSSAKSLSLTDFGLPMPNVSLLSNLKNRLLMEEKNYNMDKLATDHELMHSTLHPEQLKIYDFVMSSFASNTQVLLFLCGHGGTGKTFLWTTIISAFRSLGKIVLAVAASGIASLLLPSGRTAHSRFKIPLDLMDDSICHIKKRTQLAILLEQTSLIIWDEAPMNDRRCFESLDRTLRDVLNNPTSLFDGKSILLGGDFRQTLPIKPKASKREIISSSFSKSSLWKFFKIFKLTQNMHLLHANVNSHDRDEISRFSAWLLDIGNGNIGVPDNTDATDTKRIEIPDAFLIKYHDNALLDLIHFIYDHAELQNPTAADFSNKAIVCPKNETADEINKLVLAISPEKYMTYLSADSIIPHAHDRGDTELLYPPEYLNSLPFNGFPSHHLHLKINSPVILLRNINQTAGLCNGTRLMVTQLLPKVMEAQVITGTTIGHQVYIPRITFEHNNKELPFIFKRKQFPLKLCYAMTIHKSQGQSLNKIGVYLPHSVFSHGRNVKWMSHEYHHLHSEVQPIPLKSRLLDNGYHIQVVKKERCYLFVDKHGDAVEALTSPVDRAYFETIIMSQSCYRITEYICMHEKHTMKIVPQTVTLKIGKAAMFIQIPDVGFSSNYFNFTTYDNLHARLNKHQLLTAPPFPHSTNCNFFPLTFVINKKHNFSDYIAKSVSVTDNMKQKSGPTRLKLKLEDPSGPFIEATLWDEIGTSFDKEIVKRLTSSIIVALTSMKVTEYQGTLQFSSTPATYIYLNLDIEQTKSLMAIFKHATPETAIAQLVSKSDALEAESNRNRVTNADLLLEKPQRHIGTRFTCVASISNINENH